MLPLTWLENDVPRYYFHVKDGQDYPDLQGTVLAGPEEARREAVRFSGDLLCHGDPTFWSGTEWSMHVTDGSGKTIFTLLFVAREAAQG